MVICNKYNFIFLRIPKNASTSLAAWFVSNCCDSTDRYTQINDANVKTRNISEDVLKKHKDKYHFIHMTLQELINDNVISYDEAIKKDVIGVFRNPFHRQLSLFFFLSGDKSPERFRNVFRNGCHESDISNKITQSNYIKINDQIHDNVKIWNYENINYHLNNFKNIKNITEKYELNTYKSNKRPVNLLELEETYYDQRTREAVREYYKEDFELLEKNNISCTDY